MRDEDEEEMVLAKWAEQDHKEKEKEKEQEAPAWDEKKFKRMIWRTRLSIARSVVGTLLILVLIYSVYSIATQIYFESSGRNTKFVQYVSKLVETHEAGERLEQMSSSPVKLSTFLTQSVKLKLYRLVGDWEVVTGEITARKKIFGSITYTINKTEKYLRSNQHYAFIVPPGLITNGEDGTGNGTGTGASIGTGSSTSTSTSDSTASGAKNEVWDQLRHIDDGNVAELAFSTKAGMIPEQLRTRLASYQLHITGMPVFAGELKVWRPGNFSTAGADTFVSPVMLMPFVKYGDDGKSMHSLRYISQESELQESQEQLIKDLEWLTAAGNYWGVGDDEKRLSYLKEHGVQIYGAIVTGPVRELEKLQQEPDFINFQLGRVEIWNWKENE
ncbi:anti sigma factor C-terminal domain-containing protein [Paenibacillus eucommiae]|uniref:Sigma factor regulator C-terminal domain-containing protein n=1 Tax=Paenibacillus eucommiae TaxID=1355755 RepID=A0ABS4ITH1_9BACL|nr:anti sigma factor C-terminal domain-containing protein [Paenibacillus eucommiae]MBP1990864.1 hypothetical protein [Paenibacillus eucommiae]